MATCKAPLPPFIEDRSWCKGFTPTCASRQYAGLPKLSRLATCTLDPTTSFLTAAALIYAIGAGITAGAGTRLVHQLILIDRFRYHPLQSPSYKVREVAISLRCLSSVAIGQLARLLPSLDVVAVSQAPSPESNPNSPLPVTATVVHYTTVKS